MTAHKITVTMRNKNGNEWRFKTPNVNGVFPLSACLPPEQFDELNKLGDKLLANETRSFFIRRGIIRPA